MALAKTRRGWAKAVLFLALGVVASLGWAQAPTTMAEVMKVDKGGGRITLKHGEIKNLDMPPMTMNFRVRDAKMLDGVAVGDRVRFAADRIDGQYTVIALSKVP